MKKICMLFCALLMSFPALAGKKIDVNTPIKWNSIVVVAAMHDVGIRGDESFCWESVYEYILRKMSSKDKNSLKEAITYCVEALWNADYWNECNLSKKSDTICPEFAVALVKENNKKVTSIALEDGAYHPAGRAYTEDKKFYVDDTEKSRCGYAVYEADTDKKIAVCKDFGGDDGVYEVDFKVIDARYKSYEFHLFEGHYLTSPDEGRIYLSYSIKGK